MEIVRNKEIKQNEFLLIDENGVSLGNISKTSALELAEKKGLDVVLVSENDSGIVCKLVNYDRYRYEIKKKEKATKKNQSVVETKEINIGPNIAEHDRDIKVNQIKKLLQKGNKVRIVMKLRGRESVFMDMHRSVFDSILDKLNDVSVIDKPVSVEEKNISVVIRRK